jgi:hypothetical protein
MTVRIPLSGTVEPFQGKFGQAEFVRNQWMLSRQNESRRQPALGERMCDGSQFDCFGPGPNDQSDVEKQPSP